MNDYVDIQHASQKKPPVSDDVIYHWAQSALPEAQKTSHLTLRMVEPEEMITLNYTYRKQNKTTNVLAFPSALPPEVMKDYPCLGDIIICPEVLEEESKAQNISLEAHWAHIVIHGILHLLGYDHQEEDDTAKMQALEIKVLAQLGFNNPYTSEEHPIG